MGDIAVRAEGLSKQYRIGARRAPYRTLRESISQGVRSAWGSLRGGRRCDAEGRFWALKDVSFEVRHGEVLGIIGRNGAGKSTLLKILSRITEPTAGFAEVHGRVGSLLEVGTGFHPELTGRENVYLNGVILGMKKSEIALKFDEIVSFAEIEQFIDTPVKRYSSGMYLRLAFAVAAHLEPEILIVDEVLAVGDAAFQRKCTGKMGEVARQGRTVLFVSHNLAAVRQLCTNAMLLRGGEQIARGETGEVLRKYLASTFRDAQGDLTEIKDRKGAGRARFAYIRFEDEHGLETRGLVSGRPGSIVLGLSGSDEVGSVQACVTVLDGFQQKLMYLKSTYVQPELGAVQPGAELVCHIPRVHLAPGNYRLEVWMSAAGIMQDHVTDAGELAVEDGNFFRTGQAVVQGFQVALMDYSWSVREHPGALQGPAAAVSRVS